MATDVAEFARQLKEEGIEAARLEGEKIIAEANAKAEQIISAAKASAEKMLQDADAEIVRKSQRSESELKLVARDLILSVRRQIEEVAQQLLKGKTAQLLASDEVIKSALIELIRCQKTGREWELALGPTVGEPIAQVVLDDLFKSEEARVKLTDSFKTAGFQLKSRAGTEVIEVSAESVAEAFRRLLSPELQQILSTQFELVR